MKKYLAIVLVFVLFMSLASEAFAITVGPKKGTVASVDSSNGGTVVWSNLEGIKTMGDNQYSSALLTLANNKTEFIKLNDFKFSIPGSATISGIKVKTQRKMCTGCDAIVYDSAVHIVKDGSIVTSYNAVSKKLPWKDEYKQRSFGVGTTDLWGATWIPDDINDSDFGVVFSAELAEGDNIEITMDLMAISVYYTLPGSGVLTEVTAVPTPSTNRNPSYTFHSNTIGTMKYEGNCVSSFVNAVTGNNLITFDVPPGDAHALEDATYYNCSMYLKDSATNIISNTLAVTPFIVDNLPPVIHLNGDNVVDLFVGDTYTEAGATASDIEDDVEVEDAVPVTISGSVDTDVVGTYTLTYNAVDGAGNTASPVTRIVNVKTKSSGGGSGGGGGSVPLYILEAINETQNKLVAPQNPTEQNVLGAEKFVFTMFLKMGSHKIPAKVNEIKELQKKLTTEGYYTGKIDGIFWKKTDEAVRAYQKANHPLWVDGVVGPLTRGYLNK